MPSLLRLLFSCLLAAAAVPAWPALPESEVRAAIVVNFVHYVEWPDNPPPSAETLICVSGRNATTEALLALNGRTVHGRNLVVVSRHSASEAGDCRILFFAEGGSHSALDWLRGLSGLPILTISEGDDFLPNGGMVSLTRSGNRVVFDVNLAAARRANLRIGSSLLRLAREVYGK